MKKFLLILILFLTQTSEARFATLDDVQGKMNFYNVETIVNKNGSFDKYVEFEYEILKEGGRQYFTNFQFSFNENISEIDIISAKTIFKGATYNVDKKNIESKPMASSKEAFDQLRQISIPFKKTEIGAKILLKYRKKTSSPTLENHFDDIFSLPEFYENFHVSVKSEIPLYLKINDPQKVLNTKTEKFDSSKKNHTHNIIDVRLKRPFTDRLINENSVLSEENRTWISVSSSKNWKEIARKFAKKYDKISSQKLPKSFEEIAQQSTKKHNEVNQINFITSSLMKKIHYLGNWMTIKGRFVPRDLDEISKTQYGDCKDFTASTIAILKSLGYRADPVLVYRGAKLHSLEEALPGVKNFNHVMLRVISHSNKTYWIDPTNIVSMATDIFVDVSNRKGLLLNYKNPLYISIPESDYNKAKISINRELNFTKNNITVDQKTSLFGRKMIPLTISSIYNSREQFIDEIYNYVEKSYIPYKDRIIEYIPIIADRDINKYSFRIKYTKKPDYIRTNYGNGIRLRYGYLPQLQNIHEGSKGDIFIGEPCILERVTIFKNKKIKNIENLNTKLTTPWISIERKAKIHNQDTQVIDTIYIFKSIVKNQEIYGKEFQNLIDFLLVNYEDPVIIID